MRKSFTGSGVLKVADECWIKESVNCRVGAVVGALPWPHYSGNEVKFLGVGTRDDVYFGYCGGVHNPETSRFIFLDEVGDLIKVHWQEVQQYMNSTGVQRNELSPSSEAIKIMLCMVR